MIRLGSLPTTDKCDKYTENRSADMLDVLDLHQKQAQLHRQRS